MRCPPICKRLPSGVLRDPVLPTCQAIDILPPHLYHEPLVFCHLFIHILILSDCLPIRVEYPRREHKNDREHSLLYIRQHSVPDLDKLSLILIDLPRCITTVKVGQAIPLLVYF